jgi:putative phosphoribosyl transferase
VYFKKGEQMGAVQIISRSSEAFANRDQAGTLLAHHLKEFRGQKAVVLGIPRGGVILAVRIADELEIDFDVVLSHKLGAPSNPELVIGSICEDGTSFINGQIASYAGASDEYIEREKVNQLLRIQGRVKQYRGILPKLDLSDRIAIITDDGIATGASIQAAAWAVREEKPKKIVLAIPVGPEDSVRDISKDADEIICLRCPPYFAALSQLYLEFEQVEDSTLLEILKRHKSIRNEK